MRIRAIAGLVVLALAACGDDGGGGTGGAADQAGSTEGAKAAPTLDESRDATGEVTVCAGKDTSGALTKAIELFNERYADQGLKAKKLELEEGADEVRQQFIQRAQAKSTDCDVLQADIIWIAEFAQQDWLLDMTDYVSAREDEFIPSTLAPFRYDDKFWGVPQVTGAGLLYRRTDQVPEVPTSWQELYRVSAENEGMAYQGAPYEGLTCNFVELSSAAGGRILSEDGTKAELDSPENLEALKLMADGMRSGAAERASVTYMEEQARMAFEAGKVTFMRNWSYAFALGNEAAEGEGQVRGDPAAAVRGRRERRRPRRQRPGRDVVLRQPEGRGAVRGLLDLAGDDPPQRRGPRAAAGARRRPTTSRRSRRRSRTPPSSRRRSSRRRRGRSPRSTPRSRRPSPRTSTPRSRARSPPRRR